ncbi:DinB family protein [bacterium SCSIO 12741]|nr:DinB family protein [bacterium SCSIO 12741]
MTFELQSGIPILERTPILLNDWLKNLDEAWIFENEGGESWSPYYVVGHLLHGEITDWLPRAKLILDSPDEVQTFIPFDRFAQLEMSRGKTMDELLEEFAEWRARNLETLKSWQLTDRELELKAVHPELGEVTLRQLLASWVVHDLSHIAQIGRVMAKQYKDEVGPWAMYMPLLTR